MKDRPHPNLLPMNRPFCREVLECASALALCDGHGASESGEAPPQSKTLARGSWPPMRVGAKCTANIESAGQCFSGLAGTDSLRHAGVE
jgi:hypothetical protein